MQLREMREFTERRGWKPEIFADPGYSGAKASRPELDRMMALCRRRKIDVVVVYRFDRFARDLKQLVDALAEFEHLGIQFVSIHEQIDTSTPAGKFYFHLFAALAEFEREMIRQRVNSSLADRKERLRKSGSFISKKGNRCTRLGRPRKVVDVDKIRELRRRGVPWREIVKLAGVSLATAKRAFLVAQKPLSEHVQ